MVVVYACVELANGLLLACIPSSGLLRLGWQQLDTHPMGLGADWPDTVPRQGIEHCGGRVSGGLTCVNGTCSLPH